MRRQLYQPGIQNGPVTKRRTRPKNTAPSKARGLNAGATKSTSRPHSIRTSYRLSNRTNRRRSDEGQGSSVMWMMILIGAALSAVFILALRSQINTHKIAQAEELLKVKLDEYAGRQKFLALDQQRALNTSESDRAGRLNGLEQLRLDKEASPPSDMVSQVPSPMMSPQRAPQTRPHQMRAPQTRPHQMRAPQTGTPQARGLQTGQKAAKVVKVVKTNATKRLRAPARVVKPRVVKLKKASNNQRQASRSQPRR